jgi:hypothetical protein
MAAPKLMLRKGIVNIQGRNKPAVQAQAILPPEEQALLAEHFANDVLFRRSAYMGGLPAGVPAPSAALGSMLMAFVKNDACPEITVKSLLAGQTYQGNTMWDILCFEYIAKRAFEAVQELARGAGEFGREVAIGGAEIDIARFEADTREEKSALAAA